MSKSNNVIGKNSKVLGKSFKVGDFIKVSPSVFSRITGLVSGKSETVVYLTGKRRATVSNATKYTKKTI